MGNVGFGNMGCGECKRGTHDQKCLLHFVAFCYPSSLLFSEIDNPKVWADILTCIHLHGTFICLHGTFICLPHLFICLPPLTNICQGG